MDYQGTIGPNLARSTAGNTGYPGHGSIVLGWARHWPYATASLRCSAAAMLSEGQAG
jgi:hypothetical protein